MWWCQQSGMSAPPPVCQRADEAHTKKDDPGHCSPQIGRKQGQIQNRCAAQPQHTWHLCDTDATVGNRTHWTFRGAMPMRCWSQLCLYSPGCRKPGGLPHTVGAAPSSACKHDLRCNWALLCAIIVMQPGVRALSRHADLPVPWSSPQRAMLNRSGLRCAEDGTKNPQQSQQFDVTHVTCMSIQQLNAYHGPFCTLSSRHHHLNWW